LGRYQKDAHNFKGYSGNTQSCFNFVFYFQRSSRRCWIPRSITKSFFFLFFSLYPKDLLLSFSQFGSQILCCYLFCTGYLIPKGWKVLPLFRNIHHSPENFKEPEKFDPSRFEVIIAVKNCGFYYSVIPSSELNRFCLIILQAAPKPNTFMPFGSGIHACPGNELAKLEILVLLHHLTTKFRLVKKTKCFSHMVWMNVHTFQIRVFRMFLKCWFCFSGAGGLLWVQRMGFNMALLLFPKMVYPSHYIPRSRRY